MTKEKKDSALAVRDNYLIAKLQPQEVAAVIEENLSDENITQFDLERIKVPAGGGTSWEIENIETGETDSLKEIEGIIVFIKPGRLKWNDPDALGEMPDCRSDDCITGYGDPGGNCLKCEFAQFGSDPKGGRGQWCKEIRLVFVLGEDSLLPKIIKFPPTSLRSLIQYLAKLTSIMKRRSAVITKFALQKDTNPAGIVYSKIVISYKCDIPTDTQKTITAYIKQMRSIWEDVKVEGTDYYEPESEVEPETSADVVPSWDEMQGDE